MCYILDPNSGFLCRDGSRNCERGGLAPYEVKCPSRAVRGHAPPENYIQISYNLVQSGSKIDARFAQQRVFRMRVYEISLTSI